MKISLYTITLNGGYYKGDPVPLLDIFPLAKKWGYDGIEIEAKRPHGCPLDLDKKARDRIKAAAAETGVVVSCIGSYNDFTSPIDEHRENEMLMVREQIQLAVDVGAPIVRVFPAWSGVSRRDGRITYDLARYNIDHRFPGTTQLERWTNVRECLREVSKMAEDMGVVLTLQNHRPVIETYQDMLDFVNEVDSPALKCCLDPPLMKCHEESYYREALEGCCDRLVHTHFGGRFVENADGSVGRVQKRPGQMTSDWPTFLKLAKKINKFSGHIGYELCSPVLTGHDYENQEYAKQQAALACRFMRQCIDSVK